MKNQVSFSLKDKNKKLKCCLLQFLFGALMVKREGSRFFGIILEWKNPILELTIQYLFACLGQLCNFERGNYPLKGDTQKPPTKD